MKLRTLTIVALTTVAIAAPAANAATARALHQQPAKHKLAPKRSTGTTVSIRYFSAPATSSGTVASQPQDAQATDSSSDDENCGW
jgi:hypothetical protein